jgi:hypothetical protein
VGHLGRGETSEPEWTFVERDGAWDIVMRGGGRCCSVRLETDAFEALLKAAHLAFLAR